MNVQLKRVYESASKADGCRVLVDRIWPRGVRKEEAHIDVWLKEIAPSTALRKWFGHEPPRWEEFKKRYFAELKARPQVVEELVNLTKQGLVTLVYGAKDEKHNNAVALKEYLRHRAQ